MNERYLYRGKTKPNGEWIYGGHMYVESLDMHIIVEHDGCKQFSDECFGFSAVIPETVGQCTGRKIGETYLFDGDIIKNSTGIYIIAWDEKFLQWSVKNKKGIRCFNLNTILTDEKRLCEIAGSEWDNPELLEVYE